MTHFHLVKTKIMGIWSAREIGCATGLSMLLHAYRSCVRDVHADGFDPSGIEIRTVSEANAAWGSFVATFKGRCICRPGAQCAQGLGARTNSKRTYCWLRQQLDCGAIPGESPAQLLQLLCEGGLTAPGAVLTCIRGACRQRRDL